MKIGDLVKSRAVSWINKNHQLPQGSFGIVIVRRSAKAFHVMFGDGKIRGVWLDQVEVVSESR